MPERRTFVILAGVAAATVSLSACSLGTIGGVFSPEPSEADAATPATAASGGAMPQPDMAGRWQFATDGGVGCTMNFAGPAGGHEGTVAPEAGCPGRFFMSRKWAYEHNSIVIRNHTGDLLAQLTVTAGGRLIGQGSGGEPVSLTR
jgi:hypothetical protein